MTTSLQILNNIEISKPCPASWQSMTGDTQVRHCRKCDRQVFNLSEMTADEAVKLLKEPGPELCVRLHKRRDGSVITKGLGQRLGSRWRLAAWAASAIAMLFNSGCTMGATPRMPKSQETSPETQKSAAPASADDHASSR